MNAWVVERAGLRSRGSDANPADGPLRIVRIDPRDGATGVFRDVPVVVRLSHPADGSTLSDDTLRVEDDAGRIPGRPQMSPDGQVVIWLAERLLVPGREHRVTAAGIRDLRGREIEPHCSGFVPCDLVWDDLSG